MDSDLHVDVSRLADDGEINIEGFVTETVVFPHESRRSQAEPSLLSDDSLRRNVRRPPAGDADLPQTSIEQFENRDAGMRNMLGFRLKRQTHDHAADHEAVNRPEPDMQTARPSLDDMEADIANHFSDFMHSCLRTMEDHGLLPDHGQDRSHGKSQGEPPTEFSTPIESIGSQDFVENLKPIESRPTQDRELPRKPRVLYRAELYSIIPRLSDTGILLHRAVLEKAFVSDNPLNTKHQTGFPDGIDEDSRPAFEITTFYAIPPGSERRQKREPFSMIGERYIGGPSNVPDEEIARGKTVDVRTEAGCVLTIHSSTIIDAIESCSGKTNKLIYEGESLIVPEPFCVLLQYRDKILQYRDNLTKMQQPSPPFQNAPDSPNLMASRIQGHNQTDYLSESVPYVHQHITELYQEMDARYLEQLRKAQELASNALPMCTFEWSWLLFKTGSLVYVREKDSLRAYQVKSMELKGLFNYDSKTQKPVVKPRWLSSKQRLKFRHRLRKVVLKLAFLEFDGEQLIEKEKNVAIVPFDGDKPIRELSAFPIEYLDDPDGSRAANILKRGKRYVSLTKTSYCQHIGQTLSMPRRHVHGRIIVDTGTYTQRKSSRTRLYGDAYGTGYPADDLSPSESQIGDSSDEYDGDSGLEDRYEMPRYRRPFRATKRRKHQRHGIDPSSVEREVKMTDEMYMICSSEVNAYILKERTWALVDVGNISNCEFNERLIDDLVISNEAKRLIQALSTTFGLDSEPETGSNITKYSKKWTADIVPNKGEGQILLLHGKPGVGKTLTAECVAELTKRPLLSITSGEIDRFESEYRLHDWLRLGMLWNAILLFDEADVFLESRTQGNLMQNSMVSVFLRALENYQGLLFLTTNRIGTFDEAILSRVHVVLHYPDLTDRERERIWEASFRRLDEERPDIKLGVTLLDYTYHSSEIKTLAWNGREIRNAFNTMIALAVWDARHHNKYTRDGRIEVRREHLQQVAAMSGSFKKYLLSLRGVDESLRAKMMNLRDDEFNE